jgi:hypothetical protein
MAIHDLVRNCTVTAVWFDSDGENFVVQHGFAHLSFHRTGIHGLPWTASTSRTRDTWRTTVGLVSARYKIVRIANDVRVLSSGSPKRIARRYANKVIGRYLVRWMYLR